MTTIEITPQVMRRFILGKMGLWPGRRWRGKDGAASAIEAMGALQIDPIQIIARSHDLALLGRVLDYQPAQLETLAYTERRFFDYGNLLFYWPMAEFPYWRAVIRRSAQEPRVQQVLAQHAQTAAYVREQLTTQGAMANRDFAGNARVTSYRARKDTGLALFYLWYTGELMTYGRRGAERLYGHAASVLPPGVDVEVTIEQADDYFARKAVHMMTLPTASEWANRFQSLITRRVDAAERRQRLAAMCEAGELLPVQIAEQGGDPRTRYLPSADLPLLERLMSGETPDEWRPLATTTEQEASFLAPLEMVSARGRAKPLFNFEYIWEVYKPVELRRWGYYTLPILYGDALVARFDSKLDRKTGTLRINGLWVEEERLWKDAAFAEAVGRGIGRLAGFVGADAIDFEPLTTVAPARFRQALKRTSALGRRG